MRVLNYTNTGFELDSLMTLISESYREHPQYAMSKARMVAKALVPANPFFRYGDYKGFLAYSGDRPMANACAIVDRRLPGVGLIGFFESLSEGTYGQSVLQEAIDYLISQGATTIRGPVDLTTWNGFRLSFPDDEPPFVSEPFNPAYYRDFFLDSGFLVAQRNVSTVHSADQVGFDRFRTHFERLQESGLTFERVQGQRLSEVLPQLHRLVIDCFADTWSFVPTSFEEFQYTFADLTHATSEILVYMAYSMTGEPVGFCLGALDWLENDRRAIIKSVAVVPTQRRLEIARALLYRAYKDAIERGVSEFILSTMRDDNKRVRALTWGIRRVYRQYEVYALDLKERTPITGVTGCIRHDKESKGGME